MGKIARVKVTLPIEVYKELDRRVEYEVKESRNRTYGDLSTEDILYDAIECNYDEWSRLLEQGYKNTIHRNGIQFHNIIDDFVNYCVDELRSEFDDVHDMLLDLFDEHGEELRANEPVMQSLKDVIKCFETCGNDAKVWFTQTYDTKSFNAINERATLAEMKNALEKAEEQLAINEQ